MGLSDSRVKVIKDLTLPYTKHGLRGFLRMTEYCHPWIPAYGELAKPLYQMLSADRNEPLQRERKEMEAFEDLKGTIQTAPAL